MARVRALIRRSYRGASDTIQIGDLRLDIERKKVFVKDGEVRLTHGEYAILEYLCLNRGRYVSKEELREKVFSYYSDSNSLEVLISRIRKRLGIKDLIKSSKGVGYIVE